MLGYLHFNVQCCYRWPMGDRYYMSVYFKANTMKRTLPTLVDLCTQAMLDNDHFLLSHSRAKLHSTIPRPPPHHHNLGGSFHLLSHIHSFLTPCLKYPLRSLLLHSCSLGLFKVQIVSPFFPEVSPHFTRAITAKLGS